MAQLIIGAKHFVGMMRELYGYRSLKMNRMLEKTLRADANLVIKLDKKHEDILTTLVHSIALQRNERTPFQDEAVHDKAIGVPAIQYPIADWIRIVTALNEEPSKISKEHGVWGVTNVHLDLSPWAGEMRPVFQKLLAQGSRGNG